MSDKLNWTRVTALFVMFACAFVAFWLTVNLAFNADTIQPRHLDQIIKGAVIVYVFLATVAIVAAIIYRNENAIERHGR